MKAVRKISRRSFLGSIGGGAAAAGALLTLTGCATLGYSDSDPYDPIGGGYGGRRGRGGGRRGDDGYGRGGGGRGERGGGGCSDSDGGRNADPSGRGRRCR
jgi:hypothetical protein